MGDVLELNDVSVRRGAKLILDRVSWSVDEGERWVVLGPNGAGKTTVIQLVAGRLHPTSGTVDIIGERLGQVDVAELRPLVGLASAALDQRLPAGERVLDVVLTASYGVTGRWREQYEDVDTVRAAALLDAFGVGDLAERTYGTLSSGERKRVQIARALMPDPEVLLLDEPAAGLDLGGREELMGALAELAGDRRSPVLVLVTHHVEEIPPGFTHALLLREGTVEAAGPLEEVLTPQHLSRAFGLELEVERHRDRYSARASRAHADDHGAHSAPGAGDRDALG
ncbi:ABC transporter ATP-binding protein [Georgenia muralis]